MFLMYCPNNNLSHGAAEKVVLYDGNKYPGKT